MVSVGLNRTVELPPWTFDFARGLIGVAVGLSIDTETLASLGSSWIPVIVVSVSTLLLSIVLGLLMTRHHGVTPTTAILSSIAGGASGITAMARELGGDERVVVTVQYVRVVLIVLTLPLVVTLFFGGDSGAPAQPVSTAPVLPGLALAAGSIVLGSVLGRLLCLPSPTLFGAMALAAIGHYFWPQAVLPASLAITAFVLIGAHIGMKFDRSTLRSMAKLVPMSAIATVSIIAVCGALGVWLAHVTGVTMLDGYLATTPGGVPAVLAAATSTSSDVTFVTAVHVVRIVLMLIAAPVLVAAIKRWGRTA